MKTITYRLSFDLSVKFGVNETEIDRLPIRKYDKDQFKTFMETFIQNDTEVREFYKRYVADLFGADNKEISDHIARQLPSKDEIDSYLAAASQCPPETGDYISELIETSDTEIETMPEDERKEFNLTREFFYDCVLRCFDAPRIVKASLQQE